MEWKRSGLFEQVGICKHVTYTHSKLEENDPPSFTLLLLLLQGSQRQRFLSSFSLSHYQKCLCRSCYSFSS